MTDANIGSFAGSLMVLFNRGVRYGTVIDLGCADGNFSLSFTALGLFAGSTCVNVDANRLYEPSLREIQKVLGGHYLIAGVSDRDGELVLNAGSHPYWSSAVPPDHPYWSGSHNRPGAVTKVRAVTLDTLVRELALKPPFLLKLDVQAGELAALRGGETMLAETDVIVCETGIDEFAPICEFLTHHDFDLFDLTHISRAADGTLVELYPVFTNRRLRHIRTADAFADPRHAEWLRGQMAQRRDGILKNNAAILAQLRAKLAQ